jgi:hypothetical protein
MDTIRSGRMPLSYDHSWCPWSPLEQYTRIMSGYWQIWHLPSANALADADTESEALAIVREIVREGTVYGDLVMMFDDPALADEDLPPGVSGEELARRAEASATNPIRRTA